MATIPAPEKANFIALVTVAPLPGGPLEAARLQDILNNYEDIPTAIGRQLPLYQINNAYLRECMAVFTDAGLLAAGIFNNKTNAPDPPISDPRLIVNSTYDTIQFTAASDGIGILGHSYIGRINVIDGVILKNLFIGPDSIVDVLDSSGTLYPGSVENIWLPFVNNTASALNSVAFGSVIGAVRLTPGSFYGGMDQSDPQLPCAIPVTGLTTSAVTKDSITLNWTPPGSGYLFLNVFWKRSESATWLDPTPEMIGFITFSGEAYGFVFSGLEKDTYYDFKVAVRCNNGGIANAYISENTVCCGSGRLNLYKQCTITALIKTSPDTGITQVLCNGAEAGSEYPTGSTIAIPYLASVNTEVLQPVFVEPAGISVTPVFDRSTGTLDFSGTDVPVLADGDEVTINVSLPA